MVSIFIYLKKKGFLRDKDGLTRLNVSKCVGPTIESVGV
jgi:hypothetical protein